TPRDSYANSQQDQDIPNSPSASSPFLGNAEKAERRAPEYTVVENPPRKGARRPLYRRPLVWLLALVALAVVVLAVVLPVYFVVIKPKHHNSAAAVIGGGSGNPESPSGATSGGDGSTIKAADGSTFTYSNSFGGYWVDDPKDPFNNAARPNSWTPPLNTSWTWGTDHVYGVNIGGLFVLEPFISPALFQKYPGTVDEWTLSEAMAADTSSGGGLQAQLEQHYDTFITEQDMAQIAGAGLNWIRLPIPYWAIETWEGEPFLAKVSWKYILRLIGWARKYGLRIYLDLHTVPGSQNGYNHSGKQGQVNFMAGIMGLANAQRTLDYIRIITEFISQPEYRDVVPLFGIVNEAYVHAIGQDQITSFYLRAHDMIRNITGYGEGNGPYIAIHDGFLGVSKWADFLPGSDRVVLDTHPYFAFDGQPNDAPLVADDGLGEPGGVWPKQACNSWGASINNSQTAFGVTVAGEFSNGYNDCGLYLTGVLNSPTYKGDCTPFNDWQNYNATFKQGLMNFALASMDATQDWWFWTWKIGNSSTSGVVEAPLWSYALGLANGWMPADPRRAVGKCAALGANIAPFAGTYAAWQTGGAGAGTIAPSARETFGVWPPATLSSLPAGVPVAVLPTYTPTGVVATLPPPQLTPQVKQGDGWFDAGDTAGAMTPVAGCTYGDAWDSAAQPTPTAAC
ncbi:glycoside hydrolase family 5 protein, partial [Auriscalpium vulgare]